MKRLPQRLPPLSTVRVTGEDGTTYQGEGAGLALAMRDLGRTRRAGRPAADQGEARWRLTPAGQAYQAYLADGAVRGGVMAVRAARAARDDDGAAAGPCPLGRPAPETPRDVLAALVEAYRQASQDAIHATWGEAWPALAAQEAAELAALNSRCAGWLARFDATVDRERAPAVPVPTLRAFLAELDGWPTRPNNFGDACDRLSDLIAAHGGETSDGDDV